MKINTDFQQADDRRSANPRAGFGVAPDPRSLVQPGLRLGDNAGAMFFVPEFHGQITLEHLPDDFVQRLERRVESGLLVPGQRARAHYRVLSSDHDEVTFAAEGFLTQYNIGLNRVTIRRAGANQLEYQVSYWGWTGYTVAHGTMMGILFVALYAFWPEMRREIAMYAYGATLFWSLVGFFCLLWPWLLTAFHKGPARQALERILRETMAGPAAGVGVAKRA